MSDLAEDRIMDVEFTCDFCGTGATAAKATEEDWIIASITAANEPITACHKCQKQVEFNRARLTIHCIVCGAKGNAFEGFTGFRKVGPAKFVCINTDCADRFESMLRGGTERRGGIIRAKESRPVTWKPRDTKW